MTTLAIVALFLPLFPASVVLNAALARLNDPRARAAVLLVWPQLGVALLQRAPQELPSYLLPWALATSAFYALRLLTVRDMGRWAGFLATSALPLAWVLADGDATALYAFVLCFSLPAALMALLARPLSRRFGAAYAGLQGGLLGGLPRLSGVLALSVLAAVATPPFPGFFALLRVLHALDGTGAAGVLVIWLIWGWAATRLLQGFLFGPGQGVSPVDIGRGSTLAYAGALGGLALAGLVLTGGAL
ncbi:MAG: hypothetical protein ACYC5S_01790 [Thiobacillus sp.]